VEYESEVIHDAAPASPSPTSPPASPPLGEYAAPGEEEHEVEDENLDADHDDAPLRVQAIDDMIGNAATPGLARRVLEAELNFTSAEEPLTFREVEQDAAWRAAIREEMKAIEDNRTWELTALPVGHQAIGLKWVYKVKHNEVGDVVRHKARLMAKGYVQRVGVDFDEVFAPVARLESVRMMVALAAHEAWEVHHMDVKSAFLNGMLKEEYTSSNPSASSSPAARAWYCASTRHCTVYGKHPGPGMPSSMTPWHRLVSRGAVPSMASTHEAGEVAD
jgi:hypothetical protein